MPPPARPECIYTAHERDLPMGFEETFRDLMHHNPYPWQRRLYDRLIKGNVPDALGIPTGLGKTSVISIWLIALSDSLRRQGAVRVPTRLVYVVDRRVIVDQASDTARQIADAIGRAGGAAARLAPLSVSTLRGGGGMADGRDWLRNPDKPAVIIGTVDMVGSRLFFSGYGAGKKIRPFYAGMLGQDSLVVLDEAHLSPALEQSLGDMRKMASDVPHALRPPKAIFMSATRRPASDALDVLSLDDADLQHKAVRDRYDAQKALSLADAEQSDLPSVIASEALKMDGRTIVYVQKPSDAARVTKILQDEGKDAVMLTGTLRGFERDLLTRCAEPPRTPGVVPCTGSGTARPGTNSAEQPPPGVRARGTPPDDETLRRAEIFCRFVRPPDGGGRVQCYLVSTSAGEVGADFDADDMVSDIAPFDSLVQRLGRVNRSGGRSSKAVVVHSDAAMRKNRAVSSQLEATLALLRDLTAGGTFDASPRNLNAIPPERTAGALSPSPDTQPLTRDIVDMWSMTSIYEEYAPRPRVHHWLRGHDPRPVPETYVAWRDDVGELAKHGADAIGRILDVYPLLPHETARDSAFNVKKVIEKIALGHPGARAIIRKYDSSVSVKRIGDIDDDDLHYSTLLLPCAVGGLDDAGALGPSAGRVTDVADVAQYKERHRIRVKIENDGTVTLAGDHGGLADGDGLGAWAAEHPCMNLVGAVVTDLHEADYEEPIEELRYYVAKPDSPYSASTRQQLLSDHHEAVRNEAASIAKGLGLDADLADAVVRAAEHHDLGKSHRHWQECMHCRGPEPLAKTASRRRPLNLGGFRHEFESVRRIADALGGCRERDLALHLIAAHHGWARPCFRPNASPDASDEDHRLVMARYASLQKRFGPWGLAWLEGLLRGADWRASELHGGGKG